MHKTITIIISELAFGGAESNAIKLANSLIEVGYRVSFVTLKKNKLGREALLDSNITKICLHVSRAAKLLTCKLPLEGKIICFNPQVAFFLCIRNKLTRQFEEIIVRMVNNPFTIERKNLNKLYKGLLPSLFVNLFCDKVIFQCNEMKERFDHFTFGNKIKSRFVIYNSVTQQACSINACKPKRIVFVGRLEFQKDPLRAIRIFKSLVDSTPGIKLDICGAGSMLNDCRRLAEELNIKDDVCMHGHLKSDDLKSVIKEARVALMTSKYEGFPNSVLEINELGIPVISSEFSFGTSELKKLTGFIVAKSDDEFMHYLQQYILPLPEYKMLEIRRSVRENFSQGKWLSQWISAINLST